MKALTSDEDDIIPSLAPAFERYNETQLTTVKLPGASQEVGPGHTTFIERVMLTGACLLMLGDR